NPSSHEPDQFHPSNESRALGQWSPPSAADTEGPVVFEARFDRPALEAGQTAKLLVAALGREQTLTLNGAPLYQGAAPGAAAAEFPLADLTLRETGNALRIEAKPFADWGERESIAQNHPALLA